MDKDRKPLPGIKQCKCGSRSFVNGSCAYCGTGKVAKTRDDDLGWISKDFVGLNKPRAD